jgi:signal transduction histidine kinase
MGTGVPRDALYFIAYTGAGLYVSEALHRHRAEQAHMAAMEAEMEGRRNVEEQLRLVVQNSSIAILTADEAGTILHANAAAEQLFQGESESAAPTLKGQPLHVFMPSLGRVKIGRHGWEQLRTMMQCQGLSAGGEPFLADVWFSTYMTSSGGRITAMIVDSSVELRDREEANLEQVLLGSRIAIGALSHEIRNICAAISVVQQNLLLGTDEERTPQQMQEFDALRQLVAGLERLASVELSLVKHQASKINLDEFLRELYIVIHSSLREAGIQLEWEIAPELPEVWADQHSLLQVFLNLVRNSEKALETQRGGRLRIGAAPRDGNVLITVSDDGPGVPHPEQLFRPFAQGGGASGLGLYLSRAMLRSFHGDLRHQPSDRGAAFTVELVSAGDKP